MAVARDSCAIKKVLDQRGPWSGQAPSTGKLTGETDRHREQRRGIDLYVTLLDGRTLRGRAEVFNPDHSFLMLSTDAGGRPQIVPLASAKIVGVLSNPDSLSSDRLFFASSHLVDVRLVDGQVVAGVTQSFAGCRTGLFIVPIDMDWVERLFVPLSSLGEVISSVALRDHFPGKSSIARCELRKLMKDKASARSSMASGQTTASHRTVQASTGSSVNRVAEPEMQIGQILVAQQLITEDELRRAIAEQKRKPSRRLGDTLVAMGIATHKIIGVALAIQHGMPFVDLASQPIRADLRALLPEREARGLRSVPISQQGSTLTVAVADPTDARPLAAFSHLSDVHITRVVAAPHDINDALDRLYGCQGEPQPVAARRHVPCLWRHDAP
jgi:hypothetical protein